MVNTNVYPQFQYHISGILEPLTANSPLWNLPLLGKDAGGILLHEYFQLAEKFIQSNNYHFLHDGLNFLLKRECQAESISQIDIYLEKHGAFYHPARVEVLITSDLYGSSSSVDAYSSKADSSAIYVPILFVLNTAVSAHGLALINNEYNILKYLNEIDNNFFVPKVFGVGTMGCRGMQIAFMLANWFDGYKEFHLTDVDRTSDLIDTYNLDASDSNHSYLKNRYHSIVHIWNSDGSVIPFYPPDYFEIYEKASQILTHFYNIETFEQVCSWHHAAGDFVVKSTIEGFDVKLITVRRYISEIESDSSQSVEDKYKALLLFFLNLTLRMRIDRIDGTGERILIHADILPFILNGFFRALENKTELSFAAGFKSYLSQFSHDNIYQILLIMIDGSHPDDPETAFVREHLQSHCEMLSYIIHNNDFPVS